MKKTRRGWGRGGGGGGGGTQAVGPVVRPAARAVFCMGSTVCSLLGRGEGHLQSTADRAGLYVIDRLSITSGNTTP